MNIALLARSKMFSPVHALLRWMLSSKAPVTPFTPKPLASEALNAPISIANNAVDTRAIVQNKHSKMPLRVVRVMEAGQARTSVGRMVISGRMADVCAELDRLAAREAALS